MKYECPQYAKLFKCKADACSDNCCIGWEIGIDEETREKYKNLPGELGDRIRRNLNTGADSTTFKLTKSGRCPMLGADNLCDIIRALGDTGICEICREHPRFYNVVGDKIEWGVGLSCEAASELILKNDPIPGTVEDGTDVETDEYAADALNFMLFARERIYELMSDSPLTFYEKLHSLLLYAEALSSAAEEGDFGELHPFIPINDIKKRNTGTDLSKNKAFGEMISKLLELEFLDKDFKKTLSHLSEKIKKNGCKTPDEKTSKKLARLLLYFIYRYFLAGDTDDILARVKLAVILTLSIHALTENSESMHLWIKSSKALSKEAEYNEDNLGLILEMTYTEKEFSTEALINIVS